MVTKKTLWSNVNRTRYFLIPDEKKLRHGDFVLRTITGRQWEVDPQAIEPYEISRQEAKEWLKDQFGEVLQTAKGKLIDALGRGLKSGSHFEPRQKEDETSSEDAPQPSPKHSGLSLFAALSGESEEDLRTDTRTIGRGLQTFLQELGAAFEDSIAPDKDRLDTARRRVARMRKTFNEHGIAVSEKADEIPEKIRKLARCAKSRPDDENVAARLERLALDLKPAVEAAADQLRSFAQRLKEEKVESARTTDKKEDS